MAAVTSDHPKPEEAMVGSSNLSLALEFIPKLPLVTRIALWHTLGLSEQSKYWDLRIALTVAVIKSFMAPSKPLSISATQQMLNKDPGIKGRIWVSKYAAPAPPETGIRDVLLQVIERLQVPSANKIEVRLPDIAPVEAEWTGYRAHATPKSILPDVTEEVKYKELTKECQSPTTVLYFHGGAYYLMDPATHRPTTKKIAKLTGGRCYSVRYRLAPQNPFPAALMDALASYLVLLYPPPGAFHDAVKPEHVIIAGDSAGGNLAISLLQTLLELRRQNLKISWFGQERDVPLPAAAAVNSPWMDMTHTSPSCTANAAFDYLPSLAAADRRDPPPCSAWPAVPARRTLYVDDAMVLHPLATLLAARDWAGAPPVYMCAGWELLADEGLYVAGRMRGQGVKVVYEEYEAMPHCFAILFSHIAGSRRCFEGWAGFMKRAVEEPEKVESRAVTVKAGSLEEVDMPDERFEPYTEEEMMERMAKWCEEHTSQDAAARL